MTGKVAVITGGSQGIGAGLVTGYRGRGWAVVASALTIKPSEKSDLLTVAGETQLPLDTVVRAKLILTSDLMAARQHVFSEPHPPPSVTPRPNSSTRKTREHHGNDRHIRATGTASSR